MNAVFVNICDLVDSPRTGEAVELFPSERLLAEYSKRPPTPEVDSELDEYRRLRRPAPKIYPKENAYAGGLLRYLLRRIMNPRGGLNGDSNHILAQAGSSRGGYRGRRRGRL